MSHRGRKYEHTFECDEPGCEEEFDGEGEFQEAWNDAKDEGWRCTKDDAGNWCHWCPGHAKRSARSCESDS